ncbi:hypothetical protein JYQ62_16100 [Nostoc sp. UHCC 0702]|nr:hypothetical protein JYQ62_16100 [Nostoc sp. UHCC 0702]
MSRTTFKQVQEYAQQHGYVLVKSSFSRYPYTLQVLKTGVVINCNYATLNNVLSAIKEGTMLDGEFCELRPVPSGEPWDDEPTEPNPDDGDEPTDGKSLAVSFAPSIKVMSAPEFQSTAQISIGDLIKIVHLDECGISEQPQVEVIQRRDNETLKSKAKILVNYSQEEQRYYAYPLAAHGGWVTWIDSPKPYTVQQFNIAFNHNR